MATTLAGLIAAYFEETQTTNLKQNWAEKFAASGFPVQAHLVRAIVVSDRYREALQRNGFAKYAADDCDLYVCPVCGLIYREGPPAQCSIDDTPAERFVKVD